MFSLASCELTVLVLDFVEQPHVLDRDHRLIGESSSELDLSVAEPTHGPAHQHNDTDWNSFSQQRDAQLSARSNSLHGINELEVRFTEDICNVDNVPCEGRSSSD